MKITFCINNELREAEVDNNTRLIDLIREELNLTGTKESCGEGECGACTVILDGKTVASCLTFAYQVNGSTIYTIEGGSALSDIRIIEEAFVDAGAVQCGFCIPGMVLATKVLLSKNPSPSIDEIKEGLSGNFCRCTGYVKIIDGVNLAAERLREGGPFHE